MKSIFSDPDLLNHPQPFVKAARCKACGDGFEVPGNAWQNIDDPVSPGFCRVSFCTTCGNALPRGGWSEPLIGRKIRHRVWWKPWTWWLASTWEWK